jgi:hypothetical protein
MPTISTSWEVEIRQSRFEVSPGKNVSETYLKEMVVYPSNSSYSEGRGRRIVV